ncbi:uncharacterized protein [Spinacia oleracea]|uniref:Uncharacterized protein isoform X2 n=1 Tax=Spinacia oleracea TaxID=3562 RepID=A0ABM3QMH6_SPIOL|nr:uncharacterized protein LOC110794010 isoform X2 [Spinacia oleracea]XP_056684567.1 uncharacterized protein LOC110794010 isoform X2 [Spinacia oleracea]XP_056684568.1 uncharacterized protein LOC110794010 isoform X2 [Spinacia oleracea]
MGRAEEIVKMLDTAKDERTRKEALKALSAPSVSDMLSEKRRTGNKAMSIAVAGICLPFAMGTGSSFVLRATISKGVSQERGKSELGRSQ